MLRTTTTRWWSPWPWRGRRAPPAAPPLTCSSRQSSPQVGEQLREAAVLLLVLHGQVGMDGDHFRHASHQLASVGIQPFGHLASCRLGPTPVRHAPQVERRHTGACGSRACQFADERSFCAGWLISPIAALAWFKLHIATPCSGPCPPPCPRLVDTGSGAGGGDAAITEHVAPGRLVCRRGEPAGWAHCTVRCENCCGDNCCGRCSASLAGAPMGLHRAPSACRLAPMRRSSTP